MIEKLNELVGMAKEISSKRWFLNADEEVTAFDDDAGPDDSEESFIGCAANIQLAKYMAAASPESILAIAAEFWALEQRAEAAEDEVQRLNATAQPVSDGLIPVPEEFLYADQNGKGLFELSEDCMCRLSVALSQQSKGLVVKPGYALLPIEPTEEMLAAGSATDGGLCCIWKDMLAAAPGGQD